MVLFRVLQCIMSIQHWRISCTSAPRNTLPNGESQWSVGVSPVPLTGLVAACPETSQRTSGKRLISAARMNVGCGLLVAIAAAMGSFVCRAGITRRIGLSFQSQRHRLISAHLRAITKRLTFFTGAITLDVAIQHISIWETFGTICATRLSATVLIAEGQGNGR